MTPTLIKNLRQSSESQTEVVKSALRQALAEYLGTMTLMIFGMGSVAQLVFSEGKIGSSDQVRWSWGLGVAFGVYVSGGVSGGHLNPAITMTLCLFNKEQWHKLLPYWLGQYLGSFTASCLVYGVYYDSFTTFNDGNRTLETAAIFATYPQTYLSVPNALADQIFGTAVLMLLVTALGDAHNMAPLKHFQPLLVGLVVVAIGMSYSHNCGYALNPARDLAPRIFTSLAGWGSQVFSYNNYNYFWIPVLGPHIGAALGLAVYETCISNTQPRNYLLCFKTWMNRQSNTDSVLTVAKPFSVSLTSYKIAATHSHEDIVGNYF